MTEPNTIPLPPIPAPFEPQDLDDLIFRWESDLPIISNR